AARRAGDREPQGRRRAGTPRPLRLPSRVRPLLRVLERGRAARLPAGPSRVRPRRVALLRARRRLDPEPDPRRAPAPPDRDPAAPVARAGGSVRPPERPLARGPRPSGLVLLRAAGRPASGLAPALPGDAALDPRLLDARREPVLRPARGDRVLRGLL